MNNVYNSSPLLSQSLRNFLKEILYKYSNKSAENALAFCFEHATPKAATETNTVSPQREAARFSETSAQTY
jgi:hypothetical protein